MLSKTFFSLLLLFLVCQGQDTASQPVRVGTDPTQPPFESLENGTVVGFDPDIMSAISSIAGIQYNISQAPFVDLFQQVLNGTIDVALAAITINSARNVTYDFSVPYFTSTHVILAKNTTNITSGQDLANRRVASRTGTTGLAAIIYLSGGNSSNPNIIAYQTIQECFDALASGTIDAYVDDIGLLANYANNNPGYIVIQDTNSFAQEFYGLMFPKGSALVAPINAAITEILNDGSYVPIYTKWFGSAPDTELLLKAGQSPNPYSVFASVL